MKSLLIVDDGIVSCAYNSISSVPSAIRINAVGFSLVVIWWLSTAALFERSHILVMGT